VITLNILCDNGPEVLCFVGICRAFTPKLCEERSNFITKRAIPRPAVLNKYVNRITSTTLSLFRVHLAAESKPNVTLSWGSNQSPAARCCWRGGRL
jgi:hypothetical protein